MIPTQMTKAILRMSPRTVDRAVVAAASASFRAPSCCVSRPATTIMALSSSSLPSGVLVPSIANWWNLRLQQQQQQQQQPKEELHNKHDCDHSHQGRAVLCRPAASWRFPSSSQPQPQYYQQQQQQYRQIRHQHNGGGSSSNNNNNNNSSGVTNLMDYHFTILNLHTSDPVRAVMNLHHHLAPVPIAWVDLNNNTGSYYHHEHHHRTTTITNRPQPHELDLILAELTKALQLVESDDTYALSFSESSLDYSDVCGGGGGVGDDDVAVVAVQSPTLQLMNRNARRGKRANHGKRPCSRYRRRAKKRALGNHRR